MNSLSYDNAPSHPIAAPMRPLPGPFDAVYTFLRLFWIEIRRSQGYWLLPLMIGLGIYAPGIDDRPKIVLWPAMSMATLESYFLVAPFTAALAAWLVDRNRRRRMRNLVLSLPGSGFRQDLLSWGAASFWGLTGYAGVAVWYCGQAALRATWGGPDIGLISAGAVAVVAFAAIGILVGRLVPGKYSSLLALGAVFLLTIAADAFTVASANGSSRPPILLLMPYGLTRVIDPSVFHREPVSFTGEVVVWMLALTGVLLAILAVWRQRSLVTGIALVATVAIAGVFAAPLVDPAFEGGPDSAVPIPFTPVCTERGGFETCLHPAYRSVLDATADRIVALFTPVRGLEGIPQRWVQVDPMDGRASEAPGAISQVEYDYALIDEVATIFPVAAGGEGPGQRPASQLVVMEWLVRQGGIEFPGEGWIGWFGWPAELEVHEQDYGNGMGGFGPDDAELAAFQPQLDAALTRFTDLPDDERRSWLEANWNALRAGEISLDEMP